MPSRFRTTAPFALLAFLTLDLPHIRAESSELWGEQGELWNPASRLPDFSFAGYRSGAAAIPSPAVVANVMNFGAVGNGIADDTTAFENAIAAANNGAVLIPAGRYKITRVLYIRKSNLVLRGAGSDLATLVFTKHLTELVGPPPGTDGLESWSWSGGLIWVEGAESTTKIANVTTAAFPEGSLQRAVYQSIPSTWDETVVLPASKPGSLAAFARRKGKDWFVGMISGNENDAVTIEKLDLPFLGAKKFKCVWVADGSKPDEFQTGKSPGVSANKPLSVNLRPGGGYVAMLSPE